jgi:hypothetical protein
MQLFSACKKPDGGAVTDSTEYNAVHAHEYQLLGIAFIWLAAKLYQAFFEKLVSI